MSLSRREQILKDCTQQVMKDLIAKVKEEKAKFNKRNYAHGKKMKPKDYFYLQLERFMADGRIRLLRLGVGDEWINRLYERSGF